MKVGIGSQKKVNANYAHYFLIVKVVIFCLIYTPPQYYWDNLHPPRINRTIIIKCIYSCSSRFFSWYVRVVIFYLFLIVG